MKLLSLKEYDQNIKMIHTINLTDQSVKVSRITFDLESVDGNVARTEKYIIGSKYLIKIKA